MKNKRKFIFNIVTLVLFLLTFICIFLPQLTLKNLSGKLNLVNITTGDLGTGYKMFKVSVPLVVMIVLIIAGLCFSFQRIIKKDNKKEFAYDIVFAIFGFIIALFSILKKYLINFVDTLNNDMIKESTLLYGSYLMFILGIAIFAVSLLDIKFSKDEGLF